MSEREVVLDQPELKDEAAAEALRQATERAERAEAELAKLKPAHPDSELKSPPSPSTS